MKLLFIGHTRIGDAVLSTGLLDHLGKTGWDDMTVACGPGAAPLLAAAPGVRRVIPVVKRPLERHWLDLWRTVVASRWDMVVDLRHSALPWLVRAGRRAVVGPAREDEHRVVRMARVLGLEHNPPSPRLWPPEPQRQDALRLLGTKDLVLGIGPTANWPGKIWPAERFAAVVRELTGPTGVLAGMRVAVFGAAEERAIAAPMLAQLPEASVVDLVGQADLPTVAACLERCALYIGNDSGLMHMAAAVGSPTLGLFGPSRPEHYAPWGSRAAYVRTSLSYDELVGSPGYDHRRTGTLMGSLDVDAVVSAASALWRRTQGEAA